ncbi:hypothetical protein Droror1_Dr00000929 [Drosera rotundifolia]
MRVNVRGWGSSEIDRWRGAQLEFGRVSRCPIDGVPRARGVESIALVVDVVSCWALQNHRMMSSFLNEGREINKQFFALPTKLKDRHRLNFLPEEPPSLREVLGEFSMKSQAVLKAVIKAMERSLDLKDGSIGEQYGEKGMIFSRFNFYPRCPLPDQVLGIKPHTDGSALTIILQNKEVEGVRPEICFFINLLTQESPLQSL